MVDYEEVLWGWSRNNRSKKNYGDVYDYKLVGEK